MKFILSVTILLSASIGLAFPTKNVQYGGESGLDACGGSGYTLTETVVIHKNQQGYVSFDTVIPAGTAVSFCDSQGEYTGVVIHENGKNCGTGTPVVPRKDYDGACISGWIKTDFLVFVAG